MSERYFTPNDLPHVTIDSGGAYTVADHQPGNLRRAGEMADGTPLWWQEAHGEPVAAAIDLRKNPLVRGIGILAAHGASEETLPLPFAGHLTELRTRSRGMPLPCIVSAEPPETPTGYVRLPHLVAYSSNTTTVTDLAMWEVLSTAEAKQWLGSALPDQRFIENHLPRLLELRAAYRANQLPDTRHHHELSRLLSQGRYLSILFTYQHFSLFEVLLQEEPPCIEAALSRTMPPL